MIPKHIYQTWKTKEISDSLKPYVQSWKDINNDYEYTLFDDEDCIEFLSRHFESDVVRAYDTFAPGAFKADLWRYCVLYIHGGVYVDLDTLCVDSINKYIDGYDFVTVVDLNANPREGKHNLFNTFIASVPKHPILKTCIDRCVYHALNRIMPRSLLDVAGPGVLGRATNIYLGCSEDASFVGKEGQIGTTYLLHFEAGTEWVGIKNGPKLLRNKNGMPELQTIFYKEQIARKVVSFVTSWPYKLV